MQYRAKEVGGNCVINAAHGKGTAILIKIPYPFKMVLKINFKKGSLLMMNNNKIKLAFIEDNQQYRKALSFILSELKETEIIHELETAQDIPTYFKQELPDIVIMDIDLPGKNGIQAV